MLSDSTNPLIAAVDRSLLVKKQLRDKKGRWVEMGKTGKFTDAAGKLLNGVVDSIDGEYAVMTDIKRPDGTPVSFPAAKVHYSKLEMIDSKAELPTDENGDGQVTSSDITEKINAPAPAAPATDELTNADFGFDKPESWTLVKKLEDANGDDSFVFDLPSGNRVHARTNGSMYGASVNDPYGYSFGVYSNWITDPEQPKPAAARLMGVAKFADGVDAIENKHDDKGDLASKYSNFVAAHDQIKLQHAINQVEQLMDEHALDGETPEWEDTWGALDDLSYGLEHDSDISSANLASDLDNLQAEMDKLKVYLDENGDNNDLDKVAQLEVGIKAAHPRLQKTTPKAELPSDQIDEDTSVPDVAVETDAAPDVPSLKEITPDEKDALVKYTKSWHDKINGQLRLDAADNFQPEIDSLKSVIAKSPLGSDTKLYRGADGDGWVENLKPGETVTDKAFLSMTDDPKVASDYASYSWVKQPVVFEVDVPAGTNAAKVSDYLTTQDNPLVTMDKELILDTDTPFVVESIEKVTDPKTGKTTTKIKAHLGTAEKENVDAGDAAAPGDADPGPAPGGAGEADGVDAQPGDGDPASPLYEYDDQIVSIGSNLADGPSEGELTADQITSLQEAYDKLDNSSLDWTSVDDAKASFDEFHTSVQDLLDKGIDYSEEQWVAESQKPYYAEDQSSALKWLQDWVNGDKEWLSNTIQGYQPLDESASPDAPSTPDAPDVDAADFSDAAAPVKKFEILDDPGSNGDGYFADAFPEKLWGKYGAAGVMLRHVDENGTPRYLVVQRGPIVSSNKGKWQLPGGALNSKENDYQGTARELWEELETPDGYLDTIQSKGEVRFDHKSGWHYTNITADVPEQFTPKVDGTETGDAKWVTAEELKQLPLHPALEKNIDEILKSYGDDGNGASETSGDTPYVMPETPLGWTNPNFKTKKDGSIGSKFFSDAEVESSYQKWLDGLPNGTTLTPSSQGEQFSMPSVTKDENGVWRAPNGNDFEDEMGFELYNTDAPQLPNDNNGGAEPQPDEGLAEAAAVENGAPIDVSSWKKVGHQAGSNPGGVYENADGKKFYVKQSKSELHAKNEVLADDLYELAGIDSSKLELANVDGKGKLGTASPMIDGATPNLKSKLSDPEYKKTLQEGFAVDAWLANWDVAGLVYDNVVTNKDGKPVRIDPGGALIFRAQGAPKGDLFGDSVGEWDTLRNGSNAQSAALFGDMTPDQLKASAQKVLDISPEQIDAAVDKMNFDEQNASLLKSRLKARRADIAKRAGLELPENSDAASPEPVDAPAPVDNADPSVPDTNDELPLWEPGFHVESLEDLDSFPAGTELTHKDGQDDGGTWVKKGDGSWQNSWGAVAEPDEINQAIDYSELKFESFPEGYDPNTGTRPSSSSSSYEPLDDQPLAVNDTIDDVTQLADLPTGTEIVLDDGETMDKPLKMHKQDNGTWIDSNWDLHELDDLDEAAFKGHLTVSWLPDGSDNEAPEPVTSPEPAPSAAPLPPAVPSGTVGIDANGEKYVMASDGKHVMVGTIVKSKTDGIEAKVVQVENNGKYVRLENPDGKPKGRALSTLVVTGGAQPVGATSDADKNDAVNIVEGQDGEFLYNGTAYVPNGDGTWEDYDGNAASSDVAASLNEAAANAQSGDVPDDIAGFNDELNTPKATGPEADAISSQFDVPTPSADEEPELADWEKELLAGVSLDGLKEAPVGSTFEYTGLSEEPETYTKVSDNQWEGPSGTFASEMFQYGITNGKVSPVEFPASKPANTPDATTVAGLDALPEGSVVDIGAKYHYTKKNGTWHVHDPNTGWTGDFTAKKENIAGPGAKITKIGDASAATEPDASAPAAPSISVPGKVVNTVAELKDLPLESVIKQDAGSGNATEYIKVAPDRWAINSPDNQEKAHFQGLDSLIPGSITSDVWAGLLDAGHTSIVSVPGVEADAPSAPAAPSAAAQAVMNETIPGVQLQGANGIAFKKGDQVTHPKFGKGTVVTIENQGTHAKVIFEGSIPPGKKQGILGKKLTKVDGGSTAAPTGTSLPTTESTVGKTAYVPQPFTYVAPNVTQTGNVDTSSPYYDQPAPAAPSKEESGALPWVADDWLSRADAYYQTKKPKPITQSGYWQYVNNVISKGDENSLEKIKKSLISPELYEEAKKSIAAAKTQNAAAEAKHAEKMKAWADEMGKWKIANGIVSRDVTPELQLSDQPFVGGEADWTKAHYGTVNAINAINSVKGSDSLATRGVSFAADSGDVEDLNVRAFRVIDSDGVVKMEYKFKLTAKKGDELHKKAASVGFVQTDSIVKYYDRSKDKDLGLVRIGKSAKWSTHGYEFTMTDPSTGVKVTFLRTKTTTSNNAMAAHNTVYIHAPENTGPEVVQSVLEKMGVKATPADEQSVRTLSENKLISILGGRTDSINIPSDTASRQKYLADIEKKYGITLADVHYTQDAHGRMKLVLSDQARDKIIERSNLSGMRHNLADGHSLEKWEAILSGSRRGLYATNARWSEGLGGSGMSSSSDMTGAGADFVFVRPVHGAITGASSGQVMMHPKAAARRLDIYGNQYDNGKGYRHTGVNPVDLMKGNPYEIMYKDAVPVEDMWYVGVPSTLRQQLIDRLKAKGITSINGIPVENFVLTDGMAPPVVDESQWSSDGLPPAVTV